MSSYEPKKKNTELGRIESLWLCIPFIEIMHINYRIQKNKELIWWSLTFCINQFTFVASHFLNEIQNFYILSWILGLSSDGPKRVGQKKKVPSSPSHPKKTFNPWGTTSKKKFCEPQGTKSLFPMISYLSKEKIAYKPQNIEKKGKKLFKCKKSGPPIFTLKSD